MDWKPCGEKHTVGEMNHFLHNLLGYFPLTNYKDVLCINIDSVHKELCININLPFEQHGSIRVCITYGMSCDEPRYNSYHITSSH